jgi:hypothetical protein
MVAGTYLRLINRNNQFLLQTAAVRCSLLDRRTQREFSVDLLSVVHLAEPAYFSALQDACEQYDRVCFELIADEALAPADASGARRLAEPLRATAEQRQLAARQGLAPQVDELDMCRPHWVLADVSRDELQTLEADADARGAGAPNLGLEAVRTVALGHRGLGRAAWLRPFAWLLPAPEAALLLDDWVSSGGAAPAPILAALAQALLRLDVPTASQLSFAQTLASGETAQRGTRAADLVRARNARAVEAVEAAVASGSERVAVLYGALHMRDLRARLGSKFELRRVSEPEWRTAWAIDTPPSALPAAGPVGAALFSLLLLAVDGSDWLDVLRTLFTGADGPLVGSAALLLYVGRHALIYLALAGWAWDWERRWYLEK